MGSTDLITAVEVLISPLHHIVSEISGTALLIFKALGYMIGATILLFVAWFAVYLIEPRRELGHQTLRVIDSYWERGANKSGPRPAEFRAVVTLPNGNSHTFTTHENYINENRQVCADIRQGRWLAAYHVDLKPHLFCPK